jgi:hypothetical protein
MATITDRMVRAAKLDVGVYEEVEADKGAMGQAMTVVALSSVAAGIGAIGVSGVSGLVFGTIGALAGWLIWSYITFFIGTRVLPEPQTRADYGELLRTIGFSASPGVLRVLGILPVIGGAVNAVVGIWMLVAMVVAVRQALDYRSPWRAVGVCAIGWLAQAVILLLVFWLLGGRGAAPV